MKIVLDIKESYKEEKIIIKANKMTNEIETFINFFRSNNSDTNLLGYKEDIMVMLETSKIFRIFANNKKVYAENDKGLYEIKFRLYELEEKLFKDFVRISNSEIINLKLVKQFEMGFTGTIVVVFKNNEKSYVSRRYMKILKERLGV